MPYSPFNGILLINKDRDCTSHQIVDEVRRILKQRAVGHAGTLDPSARGLLVILCGLATKLSAYFLNRDKGYKLSLKFGLETNTFDIQGETISSKEVALPRESIERVLKEGACDLDLPVPVFSAVKVKGKKLYFYAFAGREKEVSPPVKKMSFRDLQIHFIGKDSADVSLACAKGSYIRSWAHYLGQKLETGACLTKLERVFSGSFHIRQSRTLDELQKILSDHPSTGEEELKALLGDSFLFPGEALPQFSEVCLTGRNANLLKKGRMPLYVVERSQKDQIQANRSGQNQILKAVRGKKLVALLEVRPFEKIKILKNFPHQDF